MKSKILLALAASVVLGGCSASTKNIGSIVLPTSNKTIDVVQHRSDSEECAVGGVLQTFDAKGNLIDSKTFEGNAFHCQFMNGLFSVGASAARRPDRTSINNAVSSAVEGSTAVSGSVSGATSTSTSASSATGGSSSASATQKQGQGQKQGQSQGQSQG